MSKTETRVHEEKKRKRDQHATTAEFRCGNCNELVISCDGCQRDFKHDDLAICEGPSWSLLGSPHYCNMDCYKKYVSKLAEHVASTVARLSGMVTIRPIETKIFQVSAHSSAGVNNA
jgi:hypothetical protein